MSHTHIASQITDLSSASVNYANSAGSANAVAWNNVSGKPGSYTPSSHTHSAGQITDLSGASVNYANSAGSANAVAWGNVSGKPGSYPPSGHTHDDRYYTESEVNSLLAQRVESSRIRSHSWVTGVNGTSIDLAFSQVGLTNGQNYAIIVNNANRDASNITVLGVSINGARTQFRIYWDQHFAGNVQFNLVAIQF